MIPLLQLKGLLMQNKLQPLFKWSGSKRKMFPKYEKIFENQKFSTFVDLCAGTGITSVWIHKNFPGTKIIINEINPDIYNIYNQIKTNFDYFYSTIQTYESEYLKLEWEARQEYYYAKREHFHENYHDLDIADRTPLLYFLMCTNFNGIWQAKVSTGLYYTSFGNGLEKNGVFNKKALMDFKDMIDDAEIHCGSFEDVVIPNDSLIFADPPYVDSFTRYDNRNEFEESLQIKMARYLIENTKEGTNNLFAFCNKKNEMFDEVFVDYSTEYFEVKYTASAKDTEGASSTEILVHNFPKETILKAFDFQF